MDHPHRRPRRAVGEHPGIVVSILVVVDHPHRHIPNGNPVTGYDMFILVVVDHPHRRETARSCPEPPLEFQSLLSWITLTDEQPRGQDHITIPQVSILVVVDHPHRPRHSAAPTGSTSRSFNPCCRGSPSPTPPVRHGRPRDTRVSILVVVDHSHRRSPINSRLDRPLRFQSLLSWITLTDVLF